MVIESVIRKAGLRVTGQRMALLGTLATARGPKTAEEIKERIGTIDLVTVYRNLQQLLSAGLVREVRFKDASLRYELAGESHHHHVVCVGCGLIDELADCDFGALQKKALKSSKRFATIDEHALEFFGTCRTCASR